MKAGLVACSKELDLSQAVMWGTNRMTPKLQYNHLTVLEVVKSSC